MQAQTQMESQAHTQSSLQSHDAEAGPRWNLATRIGFRFAFAYALFHIFPFPLDYIPILGFYLNRAYNALWVAVVPWVGNHILGVSYPISPLQGGSGDTTFNYAQVFCFAALAAIATIAWSVLDRRRSNYEKLYQWLRIGVRFWLAGAMIGYGAHKAFPNQMPAPDVTKLLQPYGETNGMGVLWSFMGTSLAYQSITGIVEMVGGILLIFPRLASLGALVSVVAMGQVWLLNMCYNVPVKLYSFHLFLASLFLVLPYVRRLVDVLVFERRVEAPRAVPLFRRRWLNWGLVALQIVLGLSMLWSSTRMNYNMYYTRGAAAPKPPLYGIWNVEEFTVDGQAQPPLLTDQNRWLRLVIGDYFPTIHSMKSAPLPYRVQVNNENKTLVLSKLRDPNWKTELAFEETQPGQLSVTGDMDGKRLQVKMVRYDESNFFLNRRRFTWIQENVPR